MAFVTTSLGEVLLLKYMLGQSVADNVRLHLYTNNLTPAQGDTISMYTESAAAGYSIKELPGSQWTYATVSGTSAATYARQTYTYSTGETVYGYYITNQATSTVIWAERFTGAPFQVPSGGGNIDVDPKLQLI